MEPLNKRIENLELKVNDILTKLDEQSVELKKQTAIVSLNNIKDQLMQMFEESNIDNGQQ